MILEALEWLVTPASALARRSGLLAGQIAIRHRARRCKALWQGHLTATRAAINAYLHALPARPQTIVILGSGHLHDVDLDQVLGFADHVTLVDIVHPIEVHLRALQSSGRIRLIEADISASLSHALRGAKSLSVLDPAVIDTLMAATCVISVNLLSQLPIGAHDLWLKAGCSEAEIEQLSNSIVSNHLSLLQQCRNALLVSDQAARLYGEDDKGQPITSLWQDLLFGVTLPAPDQDWLWQIASAQERGDGYHEERKVAAISLKRS